MAPLISAIGVSIFLSNFVQVVQGARNKPTPPIAVWGITLFERDGYAVFLAWKQVLIMAVTAVLLTGFWYLVQRTPFGRAQRAPVSRTARWRRCWASTSTARSP